MIQELVEDKNKIILARNTWIERLIVPPTLCNPPNGSWMDAVDRIRKDALS